jgi:type IV pilus assembly protein PilN
VQFVKNLELSQRFLGPRLSGERARAAATIGNTRTVVDPLATTAVEFDITSGYNPLPTPPVASAGSTEKTASTSTRKTLTPKTTTPKIATPTPTVKAVKP